MICIGSFAGLFHVFFGNLMYSRSDSVGQKSNRTPAGYILSFCLYGLIGIIIFGNLNFITKMANERKDDLFNNGTTLITQATLVRFEDVKGRYGRIIGTNSILEFSVNGKTYDNEIKYDPINHFIGQHFTIKYSVEYPEIFSVVGYESGRKLPF
jgi:hypothetical protein